EPDMSGMWTCTGAAQPGIDSKQEIVARIGENTHITGDATFGLNVSGDEAFEIRTGADNAAIDVDLSNNNDITSDYNAISISSDGIGAVAVTTNGTLTSTGSYSGIRVSNSGGVTVTAYGTVVAGYIGVFVAADNEADDINVTTNGSVTGDEGEGIFVRGGGNGAINVMATGTVTSTDEEAISVIHSGTGDVNITTSNTVTASAAAKDAIYATHTGTGNITITVDGSVVGGSSANAIDLSTASGDATIILGTGASFTRGIDVSDVMGNASLEIGGTGNRSFDIGNIPAITGGLNFNKNGNHTLTVTGTHASGAAFEQTNINEGKLVWGGTDFRTTSLAIADRATLGITGSSSFADTSVALSGRLELTGNSSNITVESLTGNGDIDIDVDFSNGDMTFSEPRISATSATGSIAVNLRSMGEFPEISEDDEDGLITLGNIIQVTGNADADAFVAGRALNRGFRFELVHDDTNANVWSIVARAGGVEEALYESLPATLTQLASLQSYQQRLQGRQHGNNGRVWAKVSGASTEFEPASTSLATHEIGNVATEFGIDVPLLTDYPYIPYNLTVGASASFGEATTDVTAGESTGEIATRNFKAAILANWEYEDVYVDGQLQYAILGNEIKADTKLADEEATAYSAGLEVGYGIDVRGFRVTPSAQLAWTSVDFDHFTDLAGTEVVSDDSSIFTGRAGVGVEGSIPFANILLRGNADVLMHLDGKVNTKVDGTELVSEREDPVFDVGVGATYAWDETYMLTADISTQQGSEVKGYDANIGIKYKF
ncbi:MAG: autotransporter outer membrane beta-barrel domain-containing protein, partial [Hyphomicrobiales bacterium]|nr:autotransporter outer membrane beta-barrel domain-containing protein [Hyphomicrobiales bacterium]